MESPAPSQEEPLARLLAISERQSRALLDLGPRMMEADGRRVFGIDLIAVGAIKRTITVAAGFRLLVRECNYLSAAALLRVQLDTLLRFVALELVDEPHAIAGLMLEGKSLRNERDRNGHRMTDSHLVDHLSPRFPWVREVYKETSGFIHFSDKHMFGPVTGVGDEAGTVEFLVSEVDAHVPLKHWLELVACFNETTSAIGGALASWTDTKHAAALRRVADQTS